MPTVGLHGSRGSSKSWGLSLFLYLYKREGCYIFSGQELNRKYFPNYVYLDKPLEVSGTIYESGWDYIAKCAMLGINFPIKPVAIGFDEMQYRSDSRLHRDMQNIVYSYLFIQARKRKAKLIMTSIKRSYIDTRDRDAEDIVIKCFKKHNTLGQCNCGQYGITCFKKTEYLPKLYGKKCYDEDCKLSHFFEWDFIDMHNNIGKERRWFHPEPIFPLYDTDSFNAPLSEYSQEQIEKAVKGLT